MQQEKSLVKQGEVAAILSVHKTKNKYMKQMSDDILSDCYMSVCKCPKCFTRKKQTSIDNYTTIQRNLLWILFRESTT